MRFPGPSFIAGVWLASFGSWLLFGCASSLSPSEEAPPPAEPAWLPDLPISQPPFEQIHANWKDRLPLAYVFVDHIGTYTETGRELETVAKAMKAQELLPTGPPFVLFFDDPGKVPIDQLRSRACFPVNGGIGVPEAPLEVDALPGGTVVYTFAGGAYPEVPRAYPGLYQYLKNLNWVENGPIREIYLVNPAEANSFDELVTEIQIPATNAPR